MTQKPIFLAISAISLTMTFFGFHGAAQAQTENEQQANAQQPRWIVTCNNHATPERLNCAMSHVVTSTNGNRRQRIISATIRQQNENPEISVTLPHGLNLLEGVRFSIDDATPQRFDIHAADANGSYVRLPLTKDRLSALKSGSVMKFSVVGTSGQNIILELSLKGFTQVYDLMK